MAMRIKHTLAAAAALFAAISCETLMENDLSKEPIIYVECIPGLSDTTVVQLIAASPAMGYTSSAPLQNARVSLSSNGRELSLVKGDIEKEGYPLGAWYTTDEIRAGEKLSITVQADGLPEAKAETTMPQDGLSPKLTCTKDILFGEQYNVSGEKIEVIRFNVSFAGEAAQGHYYGVRINREWNGYIDEPMLYEDYSELLYIGTENYVPRVKAKVSKWSVGDPLAGNIYFWDGNTLESENGMTEIMFYAYDYYEESSDDRWCVHLYEVTPELYRYIKSMQYRQDNSSEIAPLYPASYAYSNVEGGCGVFGAIRESASGWIKMK